MRILASNSAKRDRTTVFRFFAFHGNLSRTKNKKSKLFFFLFLIVDFNCAPLLCQTFNCSLQFEECGISFKLHFMHFWHSSGTWLIVCIFIQHEWTKKKEKRLTKHCLAVFVHVPRKYVSPVFYLLDQSQVTISPFLIFPNMSLFLSNQ